jgi:hypothetical protein
LPNDNPAATAAKIFYILTIAGSFVLVVNPIFYVIEQSNWYNYISGYKEPTPGGPSESGKI